MNYLDNTINAHLQNLKATGAAAAAAAGSGGGSSCGASNGSSSLSLAIDNLPLRYRLSEADIREMCQRWGQLTSVYVNSTLSRDVATVTFKDRTDASDCQRQLNGYACNLEGAVGTLVVVHGPPEQLAVPVQQMQTPMAGLPPGVPGQLPPGGAGLPASLASLLAPRAIGASTVPSPGIGALLGLGCGPEGALPKSAAPAPVDFASLGKGGGLEGQLAMAAAPFSGGGKGKDNAPLPAAPRTAVWNARIIIQAGELHPEFPTALKILGDGGQNVEHVKQQTNCGVQLRGHGSGTLEPETGVELNEPMTLYLSSDVPDDGKAALEMAQDLLRSVFEEHQAWCNTHNVPCQSVEPITQISDTSTQVAPAQPLLQLGKGAPADLFGKGGCKGKGPY